MSKVKKLLLCTCSGSMTVDVDATKAATGIADVRQATALCLQDTDVASKALASDGTTLIACGQQAAFFADLAEEIGAPAPLVAVDIRDRAGWTADGAAVAKQSASLAEALLPRPASPTKDVVSEGTCMILGRGETALDAARRLADQLAVTCLLDEPPADLSPDARFDVALGCIRAASGSLGAFHVTVDAYAPANPAGRGPISFGAATDGAKSQCDIILDLRGDAPLFPAPEKRDGYLRADPRDPAAVARTVFDAAELQGTFEKPLYIRFDSEICAHSRASQSGCDRCLNVCPTGAITPAGDHVAIDPDICAGCGACAAVCPSGAASYDDPPVEFLFQRLRTLASVYTAQADAAPRALFHDPTHGAEMIRLSARFGRGLPADVIPIEVPNVDGVGHAEILAAFGVGFSDVALLAGPRTDTAVPEREIAIAGAILGQPDRIRLLGPADPDALEAALYGAASAALAHTPILPVGGRREVTRLAAQAFAAEAVEDTVLALPSGAPYGAVNVDTGACTLCLACVSLCPVGALGDNPDKPQVRFQETACLQCGICESTCPENAISLTPQLDLRKSALTARVLHEEEPFECISCGKPFGVKSTIERIVATLEGKHWMYTGSDNTKLIQMCDDCRVNAQYHQDNSPFFAGTRPKVRTTEDYLAERKKPN